MKNSQIETDPRVKKGVIGIKEFFLVYAGLLLLVGLQTGLLVLPAFHRLNEFLKINIIMVYWAVVALVFCLMTSKQIKQRYDKPMRRLSRAAKNVAEGNFSIYLKPQHTADQYDYIDVIFLDFNTMVHELGSIETLKNDFVSNVSHEIKTPLAIIKNYTALLRSDALAQETREEYMDSINKSADNLSALVSNILQLNKLDNQEIVPSIQDYDLCRQLCDCALQFEPLWEQKNITMVVDIEEKATIRGNREMLEIVWNNLFANALKFTDAGGEVTLTQKSGSDRVTVAVSDTGCGIDSEMAKHIFDKFYQGDTSHSGEGNGLGLALAYRVVEKMGGVLTVVSELGKGSTFTVSIPVGYE